MKFSKVNRKVHYWGAIICALPVIIIVVTGLILILRKELAWVQPPTMHGQGNVPVISFAKILETTQGVTQAGITKWQDIKKLDVRPGKGVIKVQAKNRWEIQLDHQTGAVLQVAYRRSGLIEAIHDGTFFHKYISLGYFLPSAVILLLLWITGIYLFLQPYLAKKKHKRRQIAQA